MLRIARLAHRAPYTPNLYPADAVVNLWVEKHSPGQRRLATIEASRRSFDAAVDAVARVTGTRLAAGSCRS